MQSRQTAKATTNKRRFRFPPQARLKKKKDFLAVQGSMQKSGKRLYSKHFLLLVSPGAGKLSRLGVTVTTKIDKRAVQRNRIKRCIREVFRLFREKLTQNVDLVVIARNNSNQLAYNDIQRELLGALKHGGYLG